MGDQHGRPSPHHGFVALQYFRLDRGVERGGGFVEDQHGGIGEQRPRDGDALTFARRERPAPLTDLGRQALGQSCGEFVESGCRRNALDVGIASPLAWCTGCFPRWSR